MLPKQRDNEFVKMLVIQLVALVGGLIGGAGITILIQPNVLTVLPETEWSQIIAWILAAVVGYMSIGVIIAILFLIGTIYLFDSMMDDKFDF